MDFTLLFKGLYKPILYTIKQLGDIFVKAELWWISKSNYTKLNLRWIVFTILLFTAAVFREIKSTENELAYYNRSISDNVLLQKKIDLLESRYLSKLESDIKELKSIKVIAVHNEESLKEMNK